MKRRVVIAGALSAGAVAIADRLVPSAWDGLRGGLQAAWFGAPEIDVRHPGRDAGHRLRDAATAVEADTASTSTHGVVIVGSGVGGLSCAWALRQAGFDDLLLLEGPAPLGNCAFGDGAAGRYPLAAHYLPMPGRHAMHVRHVLADAGVLIDGIDAESPRYDERAIVHAPVERVYHEGRWHGGVVPPLGPAGSRQWSAFTARLAAERSHAGRWGFPRPSGVGSDAAALELDRSTFSAWLDRQGWNDPMLRWYLDYCCRDDYGIDASGVSAWAGLNYFCGRDGSAIDAEDGAVLTWPEGLGRIAAHLRSRVGDARCSAASGLRVDPPDNSGHRLLVVEADGRRRAIRARRVVLACPIFVARRLAPWAFEGLDDARGPRMNPWLVANFRLRRFPVERPGEELAWDNVVAGSTSLGYVVSTHQAIRAARPEATVFTAYSALGDGDPAARRRALALARPDELLELAARDLQTVYGSEWRRHCDGVEITVHGHAMSSPAPGVLGEPLAARARSFVDDKRTLLFAHADLSGYSVFEEASWWGVRSAEVILEEAGRWTTHGPARAMPSSDSRRA